MAMTTSNSMSVKAQSINRFPVLVATARRAGVVAVRKDPASERGILPRGPAAGNSDDGLIRLRQHIQPSNRTARLFTQFADNINATMRAVWYFPLARTPANVRNNILPSDVGTVCLAMFQRPLLLS